MPELKLPNDFISTFRYLNISIANKQQIMINKIVKYIKENNYYGEKYQITEMIKLNQQKNGLANIILRIKKILAKKLKEFEVVLKNKINFNSSENKLFDKKLN